jgi:hypothetical protein
MHHRSFSGCSQPIMCANRSHAATFTIPAARALLGWHQVVLARRAGIGLATLQRLERAPDGMSMAHGSTLMKLIKCFAESEIIVLSSHAHVGIGARKVVGGKAVGG